MPRDAVLLPIDGGLHSGHGVLAAVHLATVALPPINGGLSIAAATTTSGARRQVLVPPPSDGGLHCGEVEIGSDGNYARGSRRSAAGSMRHRPRSGPSEL
jgi:hypothetical protein